MEGVLNITFLGTGTSQGVPVIGSDHPVCLSKNHKDKRLRSSILLSWGEVNFIVDCGPDFRQQMLNNPIERLDGILFTHEHADHVAGIDDIRPFFFRQGDIPIYAQQRVVDSLKNRYGYVFAAANRYPGAPAVSVNIIEKDTPFELGGTQIVPVQVYHNRLPILGYRIADFAYLTDVKSIEDEELSKLKGLKCLVVNALRIEPHYSHFNLDEALDFAKKINAEQTYFTHISHLLGFHEKVEQSLPKNVHLAYDNLKISIQL